ncbi:unnamed protein product [Bursaphelenchus okinawaensis]|uniref:glutaminase n=1 Tax=Bursaphelenchus okinawaensis TaxID=465554 RepID=A0A811KB64_9BILA|nr:unnamed protein product [Bursaphelenchus okinawaensis]CAG9098703.1 unnamed protein product [Bursaphelenchus okinawaensis]
MRPVHSTNSMSTYQKIMNRRNSIADALKRTADGLANEFSRDKTAEEMVFELFKIPNKNEGAIGKLIGILKSYGIQENDPRLRPMMNKICHIEKESEEMAKEAKDPKHWKLSKEDFIRCVSESLPLISRTIQNQLTVPSWTSFCKVIEDIYRICERNEDGQVASYIPQLARVDPATWAVSICTVDGQRISFGDANQPFCIQSLSKAFNYALAASELGADYVHKFVGQEPSGRLYNEICLDSKKIPHNPLISTGAIVIASLMKPNLCLADRFDHFLNTYRRICGGEYMGFNNAVFLSERMASDRNFALGYYLNEYKCFPPSMNSLTDLMDFYLQLMSLETNCESAAVMAATLANGGVCPITNERVIESRPCRDVLSLMYSCGLYDYRWVAFEN